MNVVVNTCRSQLEGNKTTLASMQCYQDLHSCLCNHDQHHILVDLNDFLASMLSVCYVALEQHHVPLALHNKTSTMHEQLYLRITADRSLPHCVGLFVKQPISCVAQGLDQALYTR